MMREHFHRAGADNENDVAKTMFKLFDKKQNGYIWWV